MKNQKNKIASKTNTNLTWLILLVAGALAGPVFKAGATYVTWTSAAGDLLWNTALNWDSNAVPTLNQEARFLDAAGFTNALGAVNNIVAANMNVLGLLYGCVSNSGQAHFHTTLIQPGVTLTVDNSSLNSLVELSCAIAQGPANSDFTYANIIGTGGATLAVGNLASPQYAVAAAPLYVVNNASTTAYGAQTATLDMSQLDNFTFAGNNVCAGGSGSGTLTTTAR